MNPLLILGVLAFIFVIIAIVLVILGVRQSNEIDPLEARLAEFAQRGEAASLEEIEMSQPFMERVVIPLANKFGEIAIRFTPQKALNEIEKKLEQAGSPRGITPTVFFSSRFVISVALLIVLSIVFTVSDGQSLFSFRNLAFTIGFAILGFMIPNLLLGSKISKRQREIRKSMPDALDLLTICVEAGLGFEAAMKKVQEKWENELSLAFGRALQEIQLGKLRREALRDMADRIGVSEMDSFVAAVIQSEQLGVSMAKILRIQSDDMRIRRRQAAEAEAQKAPVKMLFPMALLIFPTIMLILLGPSILIIMRSSLGDVLGF